MQRRIFLKDSLRYTSAGIVGMSLLNKFPLMAQNSNSKSGISQANTVNSIYPNFEPITTTVKLKGKEVKVHALCTGTVAVKTNFRTKKGLGYLAKVNILLDRHYTEFMPIWVWVIEHPEGLLVIDTGEIFAAKDIDTFLAKESGFDRYQFKHAAKFDIDEKDELDFQFAKINLKPEDVKLVVLTHLHLDHTDGLKFFPKQEIIVGETEYKYPHSNMPSTYPMWFKPNVVKYQADKIDVFNQAYPITQAEDLLYIPTPGHTKGHSSVVFRTDDFDIIFAGDTSYTQEQVIKNELAGVNQSFKQSKETYQKLRDYASQHKSIYLPTHDKDAGIRLANQTLLI